MLVNSYLECIVHWVCIWNGSAATESGLKISNIEAFSIKLELWNVIVCTHGATDVVHFVGCLEGWVKSYGGSVWTCGK
jgi:hypothetical protein